MDPTMLSPQQPTPITQDASGNMPETGSGMKGMILRLAIGAIVLILIIVLAILFIPRFFAGKQGPVTLTYWGLWEDSTVMSQVIADFNRTHPTIHVNYEKRDIKGEGQYIDRLTTRINNGNGPDIFRFHNSWPLELVGTGNLLPLPNDVVKSLGLDTDYYSVVKSDLQKNGAFYGVPLQIDTLALFVNKDLLKAGDIANAPTSWDTLADVAASLTVPDETGKIKTSGVALGGYENIAHASDVISLLLVQNRADIYHISGKSKQNAIDALAGYYIPFGKGDSSGKGKTWDTDMENSKLAFADGSLAMYFGYSWDILDIKAKNPSLNFEIVPVPHLAADRAETIASYWVEGVSAKTKHPKEAFEFLKYLGSKDTLQKMYTLESKSRLFGELYPRKDMKASLASNPLLKPFLDQADNAVSTPFSSDTYDAAMNTALNTYLGNAINAMLNNTSPDSAIDTLGSGETEVLSKYGVK
ncbi:MAG: ABC transporter substrate-binding protein [Candidatus Levyibacteriota bacterium]